MDTEASTDHAQPLAATPALVLETARMRLRELHEGDAAFMLALLNSPPFLRWIGDRGVRTEAEARRYLLDGPVASYREHGYGMWLAERRSDGVALGLSGLVRRPALPDPDIGFAFLPAYMGDGYGSESAQAVLAHARDVLQLPRLLAIVVPDNLPSVRLLQRLGLAHAGETRLSDDAETLALYAVDLAAQRGELRG